MPRILVVDDENRYCRILTMMLRPQQYEVVTTTEGKEAARLLDEQPFDLILSDLFMEPFSGLDLLRHRNAVSPEVPFIALTAFGSIPSAVELIKEGAFDYLAKPFQEETLLAAGPPRCCRRRNKRAWPRASPVSGHPGRSRWRAPPAASWSRPSPARRGFTRRSWP